jgi:hypothetical protein
LWQSRKNRQRYVEKLYAAGVLCLDDLHSLLSVGTAVKGYTEEETPME